MSVGKASHAVSSSSSLSAFTFGWNLDKLDQVVLGTRVKDKYSRAQDASSQMTAAEDIYLKQTLGAS